MVIFNYKDRKGIYIGEGITRRIVKLFSSPNSIIPTEDFAFGMTIINPGKEHEIHEHDLNQEIIIVFSGYGYLKTNDNNSEYIKQGDIIGFEIDEPHGFVNTGTDDLILLWIYYPPGLAEKKFLSNQR